MPQSAPLPPIISFPISAKTEGPTWNYPTTDTSLASSLTVKDVEEEEDEDADEDDIFWFYEMIDFVVCC